MSARPPTSAPTKSVVLRLLGPMEIRCGGQPAEGLVSDKVRALIVFLALRPGPHDRDRLAALLWGAKPQAKARASLRTALYSAQQALPEALVVTRKTAGWDPARPAEIDVAAFRAVADAAEPSYAELAEAAVLWRGELVEGLRVDGAAAFEDWLAAERGEIELRWLAMLEQLAEAARQRGDGAAHAAWLRRLLQVEPWHEAAQRRLMRQLAREGEHAAALAQYARCREALEQEIEVEPEADTVALARRIEAARLRGAPSRPPAPADALIGRERELARLEGLLRDPSVRLVTLQGPGGIGKSRLALEAARALGYAFIDGVLFVSLAGAEEGRAFESILASALALEPAPGRPLRPQILALLAEQERLMVLDNLEQLTDEAAWLHELLEAAPDLTLLVTSRVRLGLHRETVFSLDGLRAPVTPHGDSDEAALPSADDEETELQAGSLASDLERYPSLRLFLREARKIRPDFSLEQEGEAAAEICRQLGGLPLGIRLAAALVDLEPAERLAEALRSDLDPLSTSRPDFPSRHRSLRVVFDHSWALLGPEERSAFAQLSLFQDPFDAGDAQAVSAAGPDVLRALLATSMIQRASEGESVRFGIHASAGQFARERLTEDPGLSLRARARYRGYVAGLLARHGQALRGPGRLAARAALERRLDDLRQGWRMAIQDEDAVALEIGLPGLCALHHARGTIDAGTGLVEEALQAARGWAAEASPAGDGAARRLPARLLAELAHLEIGRARYDAAKAAARASIAAAEEAADAPEAPGWREETIASALAAAGHAGWRTGDYAEAEAQLEDAQQRLDALGPNAASWLYRAVLSSRGTAARYRGDLETARGHIRRALRMAQEDGDDMALARVWQSLGVYAHESGDFAEALAHGERALSIFRAQGHRRGVGNALNNLANVRADMGDAAGSAELTREALGIFQSLGDRWGEAMGLNNLGMAHLDAGQPGEALARFQEALPLMQRIGHRQGEAMATGNLGVAWSALGRPDRAREAQVAALEAYDEIGDRRGQALARCDLAVLAVESARLEEATTLADASLAIAREIDDPQTEAQAYVARGRARLVAGEAEAAIEDFDTALTLRQHLAQPEPELEARAWRAEARRMAGDAEGARSDAEALLKGLAARPLEGWVNPVPAILSLWRVVEGGTSVGTVQMAGVREPEGELERALDLLSEACSLLQRRSALLRNPAYRHSYLEGVPAHAALLAVGQGRA